jgi:hypothetical protein
MDPREGTPRTCMATRRVRVPLHLQLIANRALTCPGL